MANTDSSERNVPISVAFIMDGNGRWAKKRGLPREFGHKNGAERFRKVMRRCVERGVIHQTYYVFSTENWKRPEREVNAIMSLLDRYLDDCLVESEENEIRFIFLGDLSVFSDSVRAKMKNIEAKTAKYEKTVNLAINYGGRAELIHAMRSIAEEGGEFTEENVSRHLYSAASPDPDLLVRTGGDLRISNFLLWQSAYTEFYFTDVLWPDFDNDEVDKALDSFSGRHRRFGGLDPEQKKEGKG